MRTIAPFLAAALLLSAVFSFATSADDLMTRGKQLIAESKWDEAATVFDQLTQLNPNDAEAWAYLGLARVQENQIAPARAAYEKALAIQPAMARALFGMARVAVATGDKTAAEKYLALSKAAGIPVAAVLPTIPGIAAMEKDAEFVHFLDSLKPCAGPEFHQFDFWIGDWNVIDAKGNQIGTNSVHPIAGGCVLQENWNGGGGGSGSSFNFYEPTNGKWHQFWVDSFENATPLSVSADRNPAPMTGGLVDGAMVLLSTTVSNPLQRWSWTRLDQGRVRQRAETSTDGGKNWQIAFEGIYVPAGKPAGH